MMDMKNQILGTVTAVIFAPLLAALIASVIVSDMLQTAISSRK
jgi:hypothetical protein